MVQWRRDRSRTAGTWVRFPPGALGSLTIRRTTSAHDVAAACRLAMAEGPPLCGGARFDSGWALWQPCPTAKAYKPALWESARLWIWRYGSDSRVSRQRFCDLHGLLFRTWESLAFRLPWEQEIAGSNPAVLTDVIRCGQTVWRRPVKPRIGGSIPPTGALG